MDINPVILRSNLFRSISTEIIKGTYVENRLLALRKSRHAIRQLLRVYGVAEAAEKLVMR